MVSAVLLLGVGRPNERRGRRVEAPPPTPRRPWSTALTESSARQSLHDMRRAPTERIAMLNTIAAVTLAALGVCVVGAVVVAVVATPFLVGWAIEARDRRRNQALLARKAGR